MGKSIYLSEYELELLTYIFDYGNHSFEGDEEEEKKLDAAERIRIKAWKALGYEQ